MCKKGFPSISDNRIYHGNVLEKSEIMQGGRTQNEEANLGKELYYTAGYFSNEQFESFSEQLRLVHSLNRQNILEIGIGNGIVADFLRKAGFNVTTVDINPNLSPDIVGSVTDLKDILQNTKFDVILCAEVLEHLPFDQFEQVISNMAETTREYAILTLPRCQKVIFDIQFSIKVPKLPCIKKGLFLSVPSSNTIPEHHWELNSSKATKLKKIEVILQKYFKIVDSGRFRFRSYHHYFILRKHTAN